MKSSVYAVYDNKAGVHMEPFRSMNDAVAVRGFADSVNNPQSMIHKHPEDYTLFHIAFFDDEKGTFDTLDRARNLATATGLIKQA